jgi:hypothetical protein
MPVILTTWEAQVRKIMVGGQSGKKVCKTLSLPIKAGHGGTHPSSQLCQKRK